VLSTRRFVSTTQAFRRFYLHLRPDEKQILGLAELRLPVLLLQPLIDQDTNASVVPLLCGEVLKLVRGAQRKRSSTKYCRLLHFERELWYIRPQVEPPLLQAQDCEAYNYANNPTDLVSCNFCALPPLHSNINLKPGEQTLFLIQPGERKTPHLELGESQPRQRRV
jgi:hypothetical protein